MHDCANFFDQDARNGKGNDLDRRNHLPRFDTRVIAYGRNGYTRIMHIDGVDTGGVGAENTIWRSKEIDPPDRGRAGFDPVAGEQASDCERGDVFADIAAFKPGGKDAIYPRLPQCSNIAARRTVPLRRLSASILIVWARIASSARSSGSSPKIILPLCPGCWFHDSLAD